MCGETEEVGSEVKGGGWGRWKRWAVSEGGGGDGRGGH